MDLPHKPNPEHLHLGNNRMSGPIPNSVGDLDMLIDLRLNDNAFTGAFPVELTNLPRLEILLLVV